MVSHLIFDTFIIAFFLKHAKVNKKSFRRYFYPQISQEKQYKTANPFHLIPLLNNITTQQLLYKQYPILPPLSAKTLRISVLKVHLEFRVGFRAHLI